MSSAHRSQAILLAVRGLQCMSQPFGAPGSCKHSSATALMGTVFVHDFAALEHILRLHLYGGLGWWFGSLGNQSFMQYTP